MTLEERIKKVLGDVEKYLPEELDKVKSVISNIHDEETLIKELEGLERRIEDLKKSYKDTFGNTYYSSEKNETYYANVEPEDYIYDTEKPEEAIIVDEALEAATADYKDINPKEIHNEVEYSNFIFGDVVYDEQLGFRVIENPNGLFHIIQKESSYFVYPSKKIDLNNPEHVDLCNELFKSNKKSGFVIGDEIELDEVEPAEIFMPFVSVIDVQINQTTYSDVLIGEGIGLDETFKDGLIKDVTQPKVKNMLTKGKINIKFLEHEGFTFQEEIIVGPTEYIDGTSIPYPRERKENESEIEYVTYLENHYNKYGYTVKNDKDGKPIYPHETAKNNAEVIENQESFDEKFGIDKFLESRYGFTGELANLEITVMNAYLKAYRAYLKTLKLTDSDEIKYRDENLIATEEAIEDIKEQRIML